ncbi:2-phosphosulfolactate phosphatase family protein [Clostridium sp. Marseille-Q7071]
MKVDIIISASDIKEEKIKDKVVVVIDVLRATSVMVTALNNGCKEVIPVSHVEEAREVVKEDREKYVLGGERNALKIEGFDYSNSPLDYTRENIQGKTLVMTTTNGTRAIKNSKGASRIFIASMINGKAVAKKLIELNKDVVFVNAGTYGEFSIDDFITSGYIINLMRKEAEVELTDIAVTSNYIYNNNEDIFSFVKNASHYKRILELDLEEDLKYCLSKDVVDIVPEYRDGRINI